MGASIKFNLSSITGIDTISDSAYAQTGMNFPEILLLLASISNIIAYGIYFVVIFKNKIKPHPVTYLVWSLILSLNFLIQIFSGVGVGSILLGLNALGCILIFGLCLYKGYRQYDKIDLVCLTLAIIAIVLWIFTNQPLYSAILSCIIDVLAFIPSFRKSFAKPFDDSPIVYWTSGAEYLASLPSYQVFSLVVLLYPVTVLTLDFAYAGFILIRRLQLKSKTI